MITKILDNENNIITTKLNQITEEEGYKMITNIHCELNNIDTNNIQLSRAVMALYVDFASPLVTYLRLDRNNGYSYLIDGFQGKAEDGYLYIDITDELQDAFNNKKNYIDLYFDGYTNSDEDHYYTFDDSLNKLYLEYSSKNDENENSVFLETPSTLAGSGEVNLATGRLTFGFNDTTVGNSALPIVVSHHYNQNNAGSNEFNCGYGWKLNAQQYLKQNEFSSDFTDKSSATYTWINAEGKEITFLEKYYYLNDKKEKVYVYASSVQLNADGSYTLSDETVVTKECVSDGGLILEAEPKYVKNKDLFYTASDEISSLKQQIKSLKLTIEQIGGKNDEPFVYGTKRLTLLVLIRENLN